MATDQNYLVSNYSVENITFSKPKKHDEFFVSKVKSNGGQFLLQLPKMNIKSVQELEFKNTNKYSNEVYNFLCALDEHIINSIHQNTTEWFGKEIPKDQIKLMYNSFLKAPKTTEAGVTMSFKTPHTEYYDSKNNKIDSSEFVANLETDPICQLKYLLFSKDTCFTLWELVSCKLYKTFKRVKQNAFVEDPYDVILDYDTDDEKIETSSFF
jgi:hypothetical protein